MTTKSFRAKIADSAVDIISLHTNNGSTGYRIKKLDIFPAAPGSSHYEAVIKVYSIPQTTVDGDVDFSDNTLLGVSHYVADHAKHYAASPIITVFDNMTFNQDIYVTYKGIDGATSDMNYYIELEQVKLDLNENTVATLKDIRNIASQ